eukprot:15459548-Alexandrium_andersonii.AAC.1
MVWAPADRLVRFLAGARVPSRAQYFPKIGSLPDPAQVLRTTLSPRRCAACPRFGRRWFGRKQAICHPLRSPSFHTGVKAKRPHGTAPPRNRRGPRSAPTASGAGGAGASAGTSPPAHIPLLDGPTPGPPPRTCR